MAEQDARSTTVLAVTTFVTALSLLVVTTRLISRALIIKTISLDDWLMLSAWLVAFGLSFSICYSTNYGLGLDGPQILPAWEPVLRRLVYSSNVLYNPALMLSKTSILLQYSRLFASNKLFKWFNIATIVVVNVGGFALTMLNAFQCSPPAAVFDTLQSTETNDRCTSVLTIYLSSVPLNIITDMAILLLPMPVIKQLNLAGKQKIILALTFGFGFFVTVIDVIRVVYLQRAAAEEISNAINGGSHPQGSTNPDFYRDVALSFMWSAVEVHVGIICASVPSLKPLVSQIMPRLVKSNWSLESGGTTRPSLAGLSSRLTHHRSVQLQPSAPSDTDEQPLRGIEPFSSVPPRASFRSAATARTPKPNRPVSWIRRESPTSLVHLSGSQTYRPFVIFTLLFFVWGIEYGWLDILNGQFQMAANMTAAQTSALHSAYYAGYLCGPLCVGYFSLKYWGFKATCVTGLAIYACGTLIFWPAAVLTSFPACFITNFIVGFGLSNIEVAANPFIILCGPPASAVSRLCLSQGLQAVGSVIAALVANATFAKPGSGTSSLIESQWVYLGMSFFTVFLAIVFYLIPLPEATTEDLQLPTSITSHRFGGMSAATCILALGVLGQFCYVGAQEVNGTGVDAYLATVIPWYGPTGYSTIVHAAFAASRFLVAALALYLPARWLLLVFSIGATVCQGLTTSLKFSGPTDAAMLGLVFFMEGPIFPLIFALALRPMGKRTKLAAVTLTSAISGGAVFSPIALAVREGRSTSPTSSLFIVVALFAVMTVFPVFLNFIPPLRETNRLVMEYRPNSRPGVRGGTTELSSLPGDDRKGIDGLVMKREVMVEFVETKPSTINL